MLKLENVVKEFQSGGGRVTAVNDLTISIPAGVFCAVIGKSGSGKSTLLSLIGALDKPTSGIIEVGDENITKLSDSKLIKYRRDKIGFIFQNYNLVPNLSALENVMLPMEFAHIKGKERKARAVELLAQVGMTDDKLGRKPGKLSGGEQQRVAIARALANNPKIILADEPTGNLDTSTGKLIVELLKDLSKKHNTTIIAVTHDLGIARTADMAFHLRDGKLVSIRE